MNNQYIGEPENVREIFEKIELIAPTDVPVLITGESGTGKEIIAQEIHKQSGRSGKLRDLNCAAISLEIIESELFGHNKGSFTGAIKHREGAFRSAHGGTIFLDEIGEMSLSAQAKLLRVLETKKIYPVGGDNPVKIDFRVVAATNQDLLQLIKEKKFREDLYYRLKVFQIHLKPLRERREDIFFLIKYFIKKYCDQYKKTPEKIMEMAVRLFWQTKGVLLDKVSEEEFQEKFSEIYLSSEKRLPFEIENASVDRYILATAFYNCLFEGEKPKDVITQLFLDMAKNYSWPGNARELDSYIQQLIILEGREPLVFQEKAKINGKRKEVDFQEKMTKRLTPSERREVLKEIIIERSQGRIGYALVNYKEELKQVMLNVSRNALYASAIRYNLIDEARKARLNFLMSIPEKEWDEMLEKSNKREIVRKLKVSFEDLNRAIAIRKESKKE